MNCKTAKLVIMGIFFISSVSFSAEDRVEYNENFDRLFQMVFTIDKEERELVFNAINKQAFEDSVLIMCEEQYFKSYLSFMKKFRDNTNYNEKAMAMVGRFHGALSTHYFKRLKSKKHSCVYKT